MGEYIYSVSYSFPKQYKQKILKVLHVDTHNLYLEIVDPMVKDFLNSTNPQNTGTLIQILPHVIKMRKFFHFLFK